MNRRTVSRMVLMLGFLLKVNGWAAPSANVQSEVNFLLDSISSSGCEFFRNGTWHEAQAAQAHLREKYNYLVARNLITTTEDFIDRAATQSSFSGQAYQVRCNGGATETSSQWLREILVRFRKS